MAGRQNKPIVQKKIFTFDDDDKLESRENRGSWTPNTIAKFSPTKDVRPVKANRYEPLSIIDKYKQINMEFDMERDNRLAMLEDDY